MLGPWRTTLYGARRLPGRRPRTTLCGARRTAWPRTLSSSLCLRRSSVGGGPRLQDRVKRHTVEHIIDVRSSCRASYRNAQDLPVLPERFFVSRRWSNSCGMCRRSLIFWSRPLTLQFLVVVVLDGSKATRPVDKVHRGVGRSRPSPDEVPTWLVGVCSTALPTSRYARIDSQIFPPSSLQAPSPPHSLVLTHLPMWLPTWHSWTPSSMRRNRSSGEAAVRCQPTCLFAALTWRSTTGLIGAGLRWSPTASVSRAPRWPSATQSSDHGWCSSEQGSKKEWTVISRACRWAGGHVSLSLVLRWVWEGRYSARVPRSSLARVRRVLATGMERNVRCTPNLSQCRCDINMWRMQKNVTCEVCVHTSPLVAADWYQL